MVFFTLKPSLIQAQTCCSGGVPISNEIGLPQGQKGDAYILLSYDNNQLNNTYQESTEIENSSRSRSSETVLIQGTYSFTENSGIDVLIPYINQTRTFGSIAGTNDITETKGIGDAVVLYKRQFLIDTLGANFLSAFAGVKLPTGETNETASDGRFIQADLQPGSGTIDQVALLQFSHSLAQRPVRKLLLNSSYINKTANTTYLGSDEYKFGNVFQVSGGLSDQFLLGNFITEPNLLIRYRNVINDELNGGELLNTGGSWVFADPTLSINLNETLTLIAKSSVPIHTNVRGEQVSPSFRFNIGVLLAFTNPKINPL